MPRIAKAHTPDVRQARIQFQAYLDRHRVTVNAYSIACGVGQPTLHRFLSGQTKSITPIVEKALRYAGIDPEKCISEETPDVCDDARIRRALIKAWDGRPESIALLAKLIEVLEPVVRASAGNSPVA